MAKETIKTETMVEGVVEAPSTPEVATAPSSHIVVQPIIQNLNPGLAKTREDADRIKALNAAFMAKLNAEPYVTYRPSKFLAERLSPIYVFTWNCVDIVVRFDGTPQKFKKSVYEYLLKKIDRILNAATPNSGEPDSL